MVNVVGRVKRFFDEYADREWRWREESLTNRIGLAIHEKFLMQHVRSGDSVLDLGSGPGRFAIDMLRAGANVTLGDVSGVQLELARSKISETRQEAGGYHELDICDLSRFDDAQFDLVVCIGGALSYVAEGYTAALAEMVRVLKPGGRIVVAAMSMYGMMRVFPGGDKGGQLRTLEEHINLTKLTGDEGFLITEPDSTVIHMPLFLSSNRYLREFIEGLGCTVTGSAVANALTTDGMQMEEIAADPAATAKLVELEIALSERPELADSGEWVLVAAEKKSV